MSDIDQSLQLNDDCWTLIYECIGDFRSVISLAKTCKSLYYLYKANENQLFFKYTYMEKLDCEYIADNIKHGIYDCSIYESFRIDINIKYYNRGIECDKYPANSVVRIYRYDSDNMLCRVIRVDNGKLHGEFVRMASTQIGDKPREHTYYNLIYFDKGIWKYYIMYDIAYKNVYINSIEYQYQFNVVQDIDDVYVVDNNDTLIDIITKNQDIDSNIYRIKLYDIWVDIKIHRKYIIDRLLIRSR